MPTRNQANNRVLARYMGGSTVFDGASSNITLPFTPSVTAVTVMMRVKFLTGYTNGGAVFCWLSGIDRNGFIIKLDTTNRKLVCVGSDASAATSILISARGINYGVWYNIAFTYIPNLHTLYINGVKNDEDSSVVVTTNGTTPTLGKYSFSSSAFAKCLISEFAYADSVLTTTEMNNFFKYGIVPSGVKNFYKLDDQPSTYIDSIGGNNGTGTATTYSPDTPVQQRKSVRDDKASLYFDGASYINVPLTSSLDVTGAFSFVAVVKNNGSTIQDIIRIGTAQYKLLRISASGYPMVRAAGKTDLTANTKLNRGWNLIVGTYDLANFNIYINGFLDRQQANTGTINASDENIGIGAQYGGGQPFTGKIKYASIYNRALTATEIANIYFNGIVPRTNLVGEWLLNEGAGPTAYDTSGNGNNGTITGAAWSSDTPSKRRKLVGENMIPNGDLSYVPVVNASVTTQQKWLDGTSGGSTTNDLFKFALSEVTNNAAAIFEKRNSIQTLKISTTGVNSIATFSNVRAGDASRVLASKIILLKNTQYTATLYMETNVVSGSATTGARAFLNLYNAAGAYSNSVFIVTGINQTKERIKYTVTFTTGPSEVVGTIWGSIKGDDGAGTLIMDAWFSEITLTPTTPVTRTSV